MDEQLKNLIEGAKKQGATDNDIKKIIDMYIADQKKKGSSEFISQEKSGVSPTKPTQQSISSDTEPPTRAQASVALGGQTGSPFQSIDPFGGKGAVGAIISEQQKTQPSESYAVQVFKKSKSEVDENLTEERLLEEKNQSGILNNLGKVAKSIWNVTGTGLSSINEALGGTKDYFTIDEYKPLQEEKIQAKKELEKEGLPITGDNIQKRAEDIFRINDKRKQLEKRIDANLPEDYDRQGIWKELKLDNLKKNSSLKEAVISADIYKSQINEFEKYYNSFKNIPREQITQAQVDKYNDLLGNAKESLEGLKYLDQKFPKILEEVKSSDELLDVFKYNYNDYEKHLSNIKNFAKGIAGGTVKLMEETARYLDEKTGLDTDVYGFREGNINMANEVLDEASEDREQFIKYKAKDISNFSDVGSFMAGLATEQIPVWTTLAIAPELGPALLGAGTGGEQFRTMEIEESQPFAKKTSFGQKLATAYMYGGAEALFERLGTVSVLKNIEKSIAKASNPSRKLIEDGAMQEVSKLGKQFGYNFGLEGGTEYLTAEAQIAADRYIAGKEISTQQANERRFESFVAGGLMGGGMTMIGGVWGAIAQNARIYSDNKDIKKTKEILSQIERLSDEIKNNPNLTPEERVISYKKMNELTNQSFDIVSKNAKKGKDFNAQETQFLVDINVKQAELKAKLQEIKDSNFSKEQKQTFINELKDEYSKLEEKRNTTLQGGYNKLTELPSAEVIRLKDKAARELMKELNPDGTKTITINDSEITKRAIQLLESETKATSVEEMSVKPAIESPIELKEGEELVDVKQDKKGNTYTYVAETSEKDGVKTTKFNFNRSDKSSEQRNSAGVDADKVLDKYGYEIPADQIQEGAEIIEINEIREGEKTTGATVTFKDAETGNTFQGEIVLQPKAKEAKAAEVKPTEALKDVESTAKALKEIPIGKETRNIRSLLPDDTVFYLSRENGYNIGVAEAYHKAKAEGTNPELVKAVEELLAPEVKAEVTPAETINLEQITKNSYVDRISRYTIEKVGNNWVVKTEVEGKELFKSKTLKGAKEFVSNDNKEALRVQPTEAKEEAAKPTETEATAIEEIAPSEIETTLDEVITPASKNIKEQIARAKKAISKFLPNVEIVYHTTAESFQSVVGDNSRGYYDPNTKKIHINGSNATNNTVAHEVFHAVILKYITSDKQATALTNRMFKALVKSLKGNPKLLKDITDFSKRYEKREQSEEKLAEVLGYLASEYETLPDVSKNIIQKWIEKIAKMVGIKKFTDQEVVDFMNTIATKVAYGQEITEGDVNNILKKIDNNELFENEYVPTNGTVENTKSGRKSVFIDTVVKESDIIDPKTLIGKPLEVVYYDNFTSSPYKLKNRVSGSEIDRTGEGGPGYSYRNEIRKNKIVAAFTNVTKGLNLIQGIRSRNEVAKENAVVGVALQNKETGHLGNKTTERDFYSTTEGVIAQAINDKLITEDQAVQMLKGAVDAYVQTKKGSDSKSSLGFTSNDFSTLDEFYKKINSISFERRGTFNAIAIPSKSDLKITKSTKPYVKTWLDSGIPTLNEYYEATSEKYTKEAEPHDIVKYFDPNLNKLGIDSTVNVTDAEIKRAKSMGIEIETIDNNLSHTSYPVVLFGNNIGIPSVFHSLRDMSKDWNVTNPFFKAGRRSDKAGPVRIQEIKEVKRTPKVSGRKQISPENSSNYANMTEDGKGNFVFYHFGPRGISSIDPKKYGSNKGAITSKPEIAAMGRVGGMSQFYTMPEYQESNVSGDKYMIKVPMDKVYDFNTDQDNLYDKAREMFKRRHPDLPFTANDQLAYITKLAEKAGYDMTVAEWNNMSRAQSTKALKPVDTQVMDGNVISKPFKEDYESNSAKGFVSVVPTSKEAKLKDVYKKINAERNAKNRYDSLYSLAEDFPKLSQDKITDMIESSDISQEMKDAYAEALAYEPGPRMSGRRQVDAKAIAKNTKAEVDRVKALPINAEDGATFNLDGTKYEGGGLVVPMNSLEGNTTQDKLSPEMIGDFAKENEDSISDESMVKMGIYKFPDSKTVSIDMNIVIPNEHREVALEFGALTGQKSLFDLDTFEYVETGGDGLNTMKLTPAQFREAASSLKNGVMPTFVSGRRQKSPIDTAVETAKRKGFNDKEIADYLVGKGYTRAQATNAILRYNKVTAAKLRKEDSVFTKEGRNKIVTFLDQVKRRALSARSFLPKSVFLSKDKIESNIKAEAKRASYLVDDFNRLVKKYKGDVNALNDEFDKYLRGDQTAVLPDEFKVVAGKMRMHIDNLSQMLLRTGAVSVSQAETIAANLGQYINRSYQVFDKKNWAKQVTDEMREAARVDLRNMYRAEAESKAKQTGMDADIILEDFINKKIDELISGEDAATFLGISKTGAKNLSIMKERLDIPLSIRQLMGEYTDASQNYARTVLKIATLAENSRFLQSARESGMGVFFFNENDPNRPKEFNTKIAGENSDTMSPLNGLYTTPEIAKAFAQKIGTGDAIEAALGTELGPVVRGIYETYMKALSAVKWLKTIGSFATHAKNVTGNIWFMLSNGYYNPKKYAEAFSVLKNSSNEQLRDKLDEYIRAGIIDQSAALGEIRAMFADADFETAIENRLKKNPFQKAKAGVRKLGQKMTTAYQLEDDFFKIISYESEKARYSNASFDKPFDQLTAEEQNIVKEKASEITKNVLPNYARIPGLVKLLKVVPVAGTFVSFQAEAYRTAWNTVALAADELRSSNNKVKAIGAKRLAGIASSQAAKFGLMTLIGTVISGGDDDEDDELKKNAKLFVAPWSKDSDLVLVDYGNGKMSYIDFSASDPHGGIKKAYNAAMSGKSVTESFTNGLNQLLDPFVKEDILLNTITDIKNNENSYGGKLYNESDTDVNKINAIMGRVYKSFEAGSITTVRKVVGSDDVRNELAGQLTGYKIITVDVEKQLSFKMKDLKDESDEAKRLYNSAFYKFEDGKITEKELNAAYNQANKSQKETYGKMMEYMKAASFFGVEDDKINDAMEGIGKGVVNDLWYGDVPDMKQKEKKLTDAEFRAKYGEKVYNQMLRGRELLKKGAK